MTIHRPIAALLVLLAVVAAPSRAASQTVRGTAAYVADSGLPAGATFDAQLQDVSRADAAATLIARARIESPGPSPLSFTISYDPGKIDASRRYVVRAQIRAGARLLFTSDIATPVITGGHPTTVSMTLRAVELASSVPVQAAPSDLAGTAWTAVELVGTPVTTLGLAPDREPHLVFGMQGRLSGADGCNRLIGPYEVKGNGLVFGVIAGTQMACPRTDELARRFRAALKGTSHWSIVDGRLAFYGATGKPLLVFVRRPGSGVAATPSLEGTGWRLLRFQGGDDRVLTPDDPAKYTIAFATGGRLMARLDCNRGRGTWKATTNGQLELGPLALTRAACPPGSLHDQIAKQWPAVRSFAMRNGHLFLSLLADGGTYEFEPLDAPRP